MKNLVFGILLGCFALIGCGSDEDSFQKIDQITNLYMKDNAGKDLFHPTKIDAYTGISMNDMLAETDNAPVSFSRKMLADSTNYLEYIAGATRELYQETDAENKVYRSQILVNLTKKISETQNNPVDSDTLEVFYRWTPSVFEVSKVNYNKHLVFTKVDGQPNNVTIVK